MRSTPKVCLPILLALCLLPGIAAALGSARGGVDLTQMQDWDVQISPDAPPSEVFAAIEFQRFFRQATGVWLPIAAYSRRRHGHVFVGHSRMMAKSRAGFAIDKFGAEDFRIVATGRNIAIAGGKPRGTLYGVYSFLEDYLGVRFLTKDHTHVPAAAKGLRLRPIDRFYHPPLEFRYTYYGENNHNPLFATRLRNNSIRKAGPTLGGQTPMRLINHTFTRQLGTRQYGKEHPEYFAEVEGVRRSNVVNDWGRYGTQLCLTNPDVRRIVTAKVLADLEAHPEWANISVSQNDNRQYCRCAKCSAVDKRAGTPMGSLLTFVNAVADEVARQRPGVMVGTLSYQYTRRPPVGLAPRDNVQIQLCSIESCVLHPMDDPNCPKNAEFCRDLAGWSKICKQIYIWNYNTNFRNYLLPFPNLRVIEPNIRYFVANNTHGIFMQAAGNALGAEFSELRNYIISNLLWDPSRSGEKLMNEFLDLHYGRAAAPIRRFLALTHDNALASGDHPRCFGYAKDYAVTDEIVRAGFEAFAEAQKLAESEAHRQRVEKASICVYRAALEPIWHLNDPKMLDTAGKRLRPMLRQTLDLCKKHGVTMASERETMTKLRQRLRQVFGVADDEKL